ncbi:MAG: isopentenyl phosphate kinase family protein [Methanosarcinales archaeon]|nr:MAG: isopentenyl phosphate kinase family protein [Methanosarcinales archaeon]
MTTPLTILKLGGSILTEKTDTPTPKTAAIRRCAREIAGSIPRASQGGVGGPLIIIHGAGSFGHPQAKEHSTPSGFTNFGIIEIHRAVASLNDRVVEALVTNGVPAVPLHPFGCMVAENGRIAEMETGQIMIMLARGIVPVLHGDVVMDMETGASIVSGDQLATYLAVKFKAARVGLGTAVDGVLADGAVIPRITPANFESLRPHIKGSEGTDVTGGMLGKVLELLAIETDINSYIFNASKEDMIAGFLSGDEPGTKVAKG